MGYNSQSKQISETILKSINNLLEEYVKDYGRLLHKWSRFQVNVLMLNCDAEILCLLEKNKITPHESAFHLGITFGILIIKYDIADAYCHQFGNKVIPRIKEIMDEDIQKEIMEYIVKGIDK
jgi:hypothetical protein